MELLSGASRRSLGVASDQPYPANVNVWPIPVDGVLFAHHTVLVSRHTEIVFQLVAVSLLTTAEATRSRQPGIAWATPTHGRSTVGGGVSLVPSTVVVAGSTTISKVTDCDTGGTVRFFVRPVGGWQAGWWRSGRAAADG